MNSDLKVVFDFKPLCLVCEKCNRTLLILRIASTTVVLKTIIQLHIHIEMTNLRNWNVLKIANRLIEQTLQILITTFLEKHCLQMQNMKNILLPR